MNEWIKWISRQFVYAATSFSKMSPTASLSQMRQLTLPKISCLYVQLWLPFLPGSTSALMAVFLAGRTFGFKLFPFVILFYFSFVIIFIFIIVCLYYWYFSYYFPLFLRILFYFLVILSLFYYFDPFWGSFGVSSSVE